MRLKLILEEVNEVETFKTNCSGYDINHVEERLNINPGKLNTTEVRKLHESVKFLRDLKGIR